MRFIQTSVFNLRSNFGKFYLILCYNVCIYVLCRASSLFLIFTTRAFLFSFHIHFEMIYKINDAFSRISLFSSSHFRRSRTAKMKIEHSYERQSVASLKAFWENEAFPKPVQPVMLRSKNQILLPQKAAPAPAKKIMQFKKKAAPAPATKIMQFKNEVEKEQAAKMQKYTSKLVDKEDVLIFTESYLEYGDYPPMLPAWATPPSAFCRLAYSEAAFLAESRKNCRPLTSLKFRSRERCRTKHRCFY